MWVDVLMRVCITLTMVDGSTHLLGAPGKLQFVPECA